MKVFIAHSSGMLSQVIDYANYLEKQGHKTFIPGRDTNQTTNEVEILQSNKLGLTDCDEVHVFWDLSSLGTIFDLGMAYALGKPIKIIKTKTHHWTKFISIQEGKYLLE